MEAKNAALTDLNMQNQGTLEEQLAALNAFQQEVAAYQPQFEERESPQLAQIIFLGDIITTMAVEPL